MSDSDRDTLWGGAAEVNHLRTAIEGILFAAGEAVKISRLAEVLDVSDEEIILASEYLSAYYESECRGIRLIRVENKLQLVSAPGLSEYILKTTDQRKPPRLSQASMETLAIVAYFQPVTRAYIEQLRGVDSAYTVGILADRGLIEPCGKLDVPGRPTIFKTTEAFLRILGITDISELPDLPEPETDEGIALLREKIEALEGASA